MVDADVLGQKNHAKKAFKLLLFHAICSMIWHFGNFKDEKCSPLYTDRNGSGSSKILTVFGLTSVTGLRPCNMKSTVRLFTGSPHEHLCIVWTNTKEIRNKRAKKLTWTVRFNINLCSLLETREDYLVLLKKSVAFNKCLKKKDTPWFDRHGAIQIPGEQFLWFQLTR